MMTSPRLAPSRQSPSAQQADRQARVLPGSWEGLLQQARAHARNANPQAAGLFQKVIDGLVKLPESRRRANDGRLQTYLMQAVIGLQSFYARSDRFDDARRVIAAAMPLAVDEERDYLRQHEIGLKFMAGDNNAALADLRAYAEEHATDVTDWNPLIWGYIRCHRAHEALPLLDELAARYGVQAADAALPQSGPPVGDAGDAGLAAEDPAAPDNDEGQTTDAAYNAAALEGARALVLLETGDFEGGLQAAERSLAYAGSPYKHSSNLFYSRLAIAGLYDQALRLIPRDGAYPARAGFWRGWIYNRQGRKEEAKTIWRRVVDLPVDSLRHALVEYTLSHFYLGDPKGEMLSSILRGIQETDTPNWTLFMLAGVGFTLRGDKRTAVDDFQLAVGLMKSLSDGRKLPTHLWHMVRDLFKPEDVELYAQFFELPTPAPAASNAP